MEHRAVDVLQPDMKWCGGLSEALKIYMIGEGGGNHHHPARGGGFAVGTAFRDLDAGIAFGRILDGERSGDSAGRGESDSGNAYAEGRVCDAVGRARIRDGDSGRVDRALGSHDCDEGAGGWGRSGSAASESEQDIDGEGAAVACGRVLEFVYGLLGLFDELQSPGSGEYILRIWVIVCGMALRLHVCEC